MKTFDILVTFKTAVCNIEAETLEEAKKMVIEDFKEDFNIVLVDDELEEL